MNPTDLDQETIKEIFKKSLTETLYENRELFEDMALREAIRQGRESEKVSREEVFKTLEQKQ